MMPKILFSLILLLFISGCESVAPNPPQKKGERIYGITNGLFNNRWWNYYERALSFEDGGFWKEAELDLRNAVRQRDSDKRKSRTYGMHFIEYFPHRELGVALFHQGKIKEAEAELEYSLKSEISAKAQFYLDLVRQTLIVKDQSHKSPPSITINSPQNGFLTNALYASIKGLVSDDNFVQKIMVLNQTTGVQKNIRMDVSEKKKVFETTIPIDAGDNTLIVRASNLIGKTSESVLTVIADRIGPVVNINEMKIFESGDKVILKGYAFDNSGLAEMTVNGKNIRLNGSQGIKIEKQIEITPGQKEITLLCRDIAGNVTYATLSLSNNIRAEKYSLLAELPYSDRITLSDSEKKSLILANSRPFFELRHLKDEQITYIDQLVVEGSVYDVKGIEKFYVNDKQIFDVSNAQNYISGGSGGKFFFTDFLKLREGENIITFRVINHAGFSETRTIKVIYKIPKIKKSESRLRIAISRFDRKNAGNLSFGFEENLKKRIEDRSRFNSRLELSSRSSDRKELLRQKQAEGFDCILFGDIYEENITKSLNIKAILVDTQDENELTVVDVYDQNIDTDKLNKLALAMETKLCDEVPMIDGKILEIKNNKIYIDKGRASNVKTAMKLIVYDGANKTGESIRDRDFREIGEAKVGAVEDEKSEAYLQKNTEPIRQEHGVVSR